MKDCSVNVFHTLLGPFTLSPQFIEQRLGIFEISGVEALGEAV